MPFHCTFLDLPADSMPTSERYRDYFLRYDPDQWRMGSGGSFSFKDDSGNDWSMIIIEDPGHGISLMFDINVPSQPDDKGEWWTVGNRETINNFIETKDDLTVPAGSFLDPKEAWLAVEDFLANPRVRSSRVSWVSGGTLNWPEF